jgi:anti-sigma factor RsiW
MNEVGRFWSRQCETAREWASLRLDGELSELEEAMLRRHVACCPDCGAFAEAAESFTARLRSASLETLASVFDAVPQSTGRRRFVGVGAVAAALAASAAVLFAPGLAGGPTPVQLSDAGAGTADVTLDVMRAGQRARMRLPESITYARIRVIELT